MIITGKWDRNLQEKVFENLVIPKEPGLSPFSKIMHIRNFLFRASFFLEIPGKYDVDAYSKMDQ